MYDDGSGAWCGLNEIILLSVYNTIFIIILQIL